MFFNKKVWDDFEKEIKKWEREQDIDNNLKLVIEESQLDRLKVAAQIISTVVIDEIVETEDTNRLKAINTILTYLRTMIIELVDKY